MTTRVEIAQPQPLRHWIGKGVLEKRRWFNKIGYEPHPGQMAFHEQRKQFRVCACGWGWGKTRAAARDYEPMFLSPGTIGWIVAPSLALGEKPFRVFYDDLVPLFGAGFFKERKYDINGRMILKLPDELGGSSVEVKTERHPESLEGENVDWVIFEEASLMKQRTFERVYGRLRMGGEACFLFTPDGFNWMYDKYQLASNPTYLDRWWSRTGPSSENPYLNPQWLIDVQRDLTPESYESKILGKFRTNVGYVLSDFDDAIHIADFDVNPIWPSYLCIDYGYTNPFVCLLVQIAPNGQVRICREYYQTHCDMATHGAYITRLWESNPEWNWYRPIIDDPGGAQDRVELAKTLPEDFRALKGIQREREVAYKLIQRHFKPLGSVPGTLVSRKCPRFADECRLWRFPEQRSSREDDELPVKKNDHGPEALSRLLAYLDGAHKARDLKPHYGGKRVF